MHVTCGRSPARCARRIDSAMALAAGHFRMRSSVVSEADSSPKSTNRKPALAISAYCSAVSTPGIMLQPITTRLW